MGIALQILITGTAVGIIYGLVAICIALIYRLSGVIHLAVGEIASLGFFVALLLLGGLAETAGEQPSGARFILASVIALAAAAAGSVIVYMVGVRPALRQGSVFGWIAGTVSAALLISGGIRAVFRASSYVMADPIPFEKLSNGVIDLPGGASLQVRDVFVALAGSAVAALAGWLLERTRTGRGLRAITQDRVAAALVGIPIQRSLILAFAFSGVLICAAVLIALPGHSVSLETGTLLGVKGLAVAAAARFRLPRRVLAVGVALGIVETTIATLSPFAIPGPGLSQIVPLLAALILLAVRARAREGLEVA